jgi:hypothetical protein
MDEANENATESKASEAVEVVSTSEVTDATSNTEPAVTAPVAPNVPEPGVVSQDGPTARNDLQKAGEMVEAVISHVAATKSIHHDTTELEDKLKEVRTWIAKELGVAESVFGNPAA